MGDNRKIGDTQVQEASDNKVKTPDAAQTESNAGMQELSQGAKDYAQARKEGLRDPHTQELLPPQPEIVDGSDAKADLNQPVDAQKAPGVDRDSDGRVTSVTYPDGTENRVQYDENGNVSQLDTRDGSTWKKNEEGEWKRTKNGEPVEDSVGDFHVTESGDIVATRKDGSVDMIKHPDGSKTEFSEDGKSQMTRDENDRPTSVTYADGSTNKIKYDENGNVAELHTRDGSTWKKNEDGEWKRTKDGKPVEDEVGDFQVTEDGDIVALRKDGSVDAIKHRDGSTTEYGTDGNSQMTKDADGRPTSITYGDGTTNKVKYDDNGNVAELSTRDGSTWKKDESGEWKRTKNGEPVEDEVGDFQVTKDGDIVALRKDGTVDAIKHKDGSKTEFSQDGKSQMTSDSDGRPTSITYPEGHTNKITYDGDKVMEIKVADSTWKRGDDGKWTRYDEAGKVVETSDGDFKVEKNGDLVALKADGTVDEVLHRDGTLG